MRKRVIELTTDATLSKNQSGSLIILNATAGLIVTLPTGSRGLQYEFVCRTAPGASSAVYKISAGSNSMVGQVIVASQSGGADVAGLYYTVDQTARVASMNGSTSGGEIGTNVKVICDENGVWHFSGVAIGIAGHQTPFGAA